MGQMAAPLPPPRLHVQQYRTMVRTFRVYGFIHSKPYYLVWYPCCEVQIMCMIDSYLHGMGMEGSQDSALGTDRGSSEASQGHAGQTWPQVIA